MSWKSGSLNLLDRLGHTGSVTGRLYLYPYDGGRHTVRRHISEEAVVRCHRCENFKYHKVQSVPMLDYVPGREHVWGTDWRQLRACLI
jgi:hypothetical protein